MLMVRLKRNRLQQLQEKIDKQNERPKATNLQIFPLSSSYLVQNETDDLACIILNTSKDTEYLNHAGITK